MLPSQKKTKQIAAILVKYQEAEDYSTPKVTAIPIGVFEGEAMVCGNECWRVVVYGGEWRRCMVERSGEWWWVMVRGGVWW